MATPAFKRLRSVDVEYYRTVDVSTFVVRIRARWISDVGGIEYTQFDYEIQEPDHPDLDTAVAHLLMRTADRL